MAEEKKPQTIAEEAGLPDNWVPLDSPPIIPSEPPRTGILGDGSSKYAVGSLPPSYQADASFVQTAAYAARIPQLSLMPLGIQGNPATNAAITSTARKTIKFPPAAAAGGNLTVFRAVLVIAALVAGLPWMPSGINESCGVRAA